MHSYVYIHTHIHIYIYIHIHIYMYTYILICMYTYTYIYTQIHIWRACELLQHLPGARKSLRRHNGPWAARLTQSEKAFQHWCVLLHHRSTSCMCVWECVRHDALHMWDITYDVCAARHISWEKHDEFCLWDLINCLSQLCVWDMTRRVCETWRIMCVIHDA